MSSFSKSLFVALLALSFALLCSPDKSHAQQGGQQPQIVWSTVQAMIDAQPESYVYLQAKIKSVKAPDPGSRQPWILYVEDNTAIGRVIIFQEIWEQIENPEQFEPGIIIQVFGKTNDYKEQRQLIAEGPRWIRQAPGVLQIPDSARRGSNAGNDGFTQMSIGGISIKTIGQNVVVRGVVKEIEKSEQARVPTKVKLADKTGEIEVIYWREVSNNLPLPNEPAVGRPLEIRGTVGEYQDRMQIRILNPNDIRRVEEVSMRDAGNNNRM